jgi:hypothetical protein
MPLYQQYLLATDEAERLRLGKKLSVVARSLHIGLDPDSMFCIVTQSKDYLDLAYKFRNSIVNNYVRYAYKAAKIFCASKTNSLDFQDVWHNFLAAITKAIDKYDCSKGALTSYIKWWILNSQTSNSASQEYGLAYDIPQQQRKGLAIKSRTSVNFSVSLDSLISSDHGDAALRDYVTEEKGLDECLERDQDIDHTMYLIKKADLSGGLARLYLDLAEYFSKKEIRKMVQTMHDQGTFSDKPKRETERV